MAKCFAAETSIWVSRVDPLEAGAASAKFVIIRMEECGTFAESPELILAQTVNTRLLFLPPHLIAGIIIAFLETPDFQSQSTDDWVETPLLFPPTFWKAAADWKQFRENS